MVTIIDMDQYKKPWRDNMFGHIVQPRWEVVWELAVYFLKTLKVHQSGHYCTYALLRCVNMHTLCEMCPSSPAKDLSLF